jgi:hypothetical protein
MSGKCPSKRPDERDVGRRVRSGPQHSPHDWQGDRNSRDVTRIQVTMTQQAAESSSSSQCKSTRRASAAIRPLVTEGRYQSRTTAHNVPKGRTGVRPSPKIGILINGSTVAVPAAISSKVQVHIVARRRTWYPGLRTFQIVLTIQTAGR